VRPISSFVSTTSAADRRWQNAGEYAPADVEKNKSRLRAGSRRMMKYRCAICWSADLPGQHGGGLDRTNIAIAGTYLADDYPSKVSWVGV
jgi:hypothetical protein